jgi:ankyrin repeat protein
VKQGHDHIIEMLVDAGAQLCLEPERGCRALCEAVVATDLAALRRLLFAGAQASWAGPDGVTALHIAAADGNLAAAQVFVCLSA